MLVVHMVVVDSVDFDLFKATLKPTTFVTG